MQVTRLRLAASSVVLSFDHCDGRPDPDPVEAACYAALRRAIGLVVTRAAQPLEIEVLGELDPRACRPRSSAPWR